MPEYSHGETERRNQRAGTQQNGGIGTDHDQSGTRDGIDTWISTPEVVLETRGRGVRISFPIGGRDPGHKKLKDAFERAVHPYRSDVRVGWQPQTQTAG
jgi:hypothetical protein